jgi:hypothetical protein
MRRIEVNYKKWTQKNKVFESSAESYIRETAWSASFISYVYKLVDPSFPRASAHTKYAQLLRSNPGWEVLDPSKTPLKVGDITVKNREGNQQVFSNKIYKGKSHGDIITTVLNDVAYGIGGNLSNTVKEAKIKLDNGILSDSSYFVVLRPKSETVANKAVELARQELKIWDQNNWTEKDVESYPKLQAYYNAGHLSIPGYPKSDIDFESGQPINIDTVKIDEVEPELTQPTTTDKFGEETVKVYSYSPDPYIYCVKDGVWYAKEGPDGKKGSWEYFDDWTSLQNNCKATDVLDRRHYGARTPQEIEKNHKEFCETPDMEQQNRRVWLETVSGKTSTPTVSSTISSDDDIIVF